jgi:hypothetical protein
VVIYSCALIFESYELQHRTFSSRIYPVAAPNGSTVIVYGHSTGIRILWRGGRRRREGHAQNATGPHVNGRRQGQEQAPGSDDAPPAFEDEEDEIDPDCPYPSLIQDVDVQIDVEALHLAVPALPTPSLSRDDTLRKHGAVVIGCSDGSLRVLSFDLSPPTSAGKTRYIKEIISGQVIFPHPEGPCTALTAKIIPAEHSNDEKQPASILLVSTVSDILRLYQFDVFEDLSTSEQDAQVRVATLPHRAKQVAFHPSASSTELLVVDTSGAVRIYDPFAPPLPSQDIENATPETGRWSISLTTSYQHRDGGLPRRKQILEAQWVLSGKAILALLEDGEWGIWDCTASSAANKAMGDFALHGFLGTSTNTDASLGRQQKSSSRLAPMTPNTRKTKAETFFGGAPKAPGAAAQGGISVSTSSIRASQTDESVVLWYNGDIYSIPSLQQFWQRSTNSSNNNFGSLYAPGLTHITDINLMHESITAISQFAASAANSGVGHMNTQRDLLVAGEHRLIVAQTLRPITPARQLFQQFIPERPASRDQRMLDAGELRIGGLDRMLDSMENGDARPRRVGFAAS